MNGGRPVSSSYSAQPSESDPAPYSAADQPEPQVTRAARGRQATGGAPACPCDEHPLTGAKRASQAALATHLLQRTGSPNCHTRPQSRQLPIRSIRRTTTRGSGGASASWNRSEYV
ncbi:hypothetical protein GCM10010313_26810 [Streptomyces violarus]|nr:hypothetical protein GCM10010313_26810 [Streptomyces violarus]